MPANKYALLRYRIIDRCLTNKARPFPSKEDLRQACEDALYGSDGEQISISTIEKDLWAMRNEGELGYYAPIAYSKYEKGYYYEDADYTINDINLGDDDLEALFFAADTLAQFRDIPLFRSYKTAIDKIVSKLRVNRDPNDRTTDAFIQFEEAPEVQGLEHLSPLAEAIKSRYRVDVAYSKFTSDTAEHYLIEPYLLKEYRNRWYLIGYNANLSDFRTYALDRIRSVERTGETFDPTTEFNPDNFFRHSIGITQLNSEPVQIVLRSTPLQAKYLESQPLHKSQKLRFLDDGSAEVSLNVLITYELINEVMGYGKALEVISPVELRERIATELAAALNYYS